MRIASNWGWAAAMGTVLFAVAACSSLDVSSTEPAQPVDGKLSTKPGKVLTISPGQLLAATNGVTPVAFGKPVHGSVVYGAYGAMVYTPDVGFTGTDQLPVTVSPAVQTQAQDAAQWHSGQRRDLDRRHDQAAR